MIFTESNLLEYLRDPELEPIQTGRNDEHMRHWRRYLEQSRKETLSELKSYWNNLTIIVGMHADKLKTLYGLDFLAYMWNYLPDDIYAKIVRLFIVESELQRFVVTDLVNVQYEELAIDV